MLSLGRTRAIQIEILASWEINQKVATKVAAIPETESPRLRDEIAAELSMEMVTRLPAISARHVQRGEAGARSSKPKMLLVKRSWRFHTVGTVEVKDALTERNPDGVPLKATSAIISESEAASV